MAINYEPVGWDTTKHFNPTNMNHMDGGIKAACDKVDEHDSEIAEINSNLQKCHISGDINLEMLYFHWGGNVTAGQTVNAGSFESNIPKGKSFVCMFMTPLANTHVSLSYLGRNVYAYSESYSGSFEYDVLMVVS